MIDFNAKKKLINNMLIKNTYGKITYVNGYKIVSNGPDVSKGDLCKIKSKDDDILCEVIGFKGTEKFLMPLNPIHNIKANDKVYKISQTLDVNISEDYLGCVLNGIGNIIKDNNVNHKKKEKCFLYNSAPLPTERGYIDTVFSTGIKAIDGLFTIGMGQRLGIFAGSGVGKTTLLSNILKGNNADINVIALIGERGRELNEFIKILGEDIKKTIIITATSNESPLLRLKCAYTATAISEYFRDKNKNVFLVMDSLTRFAIAQREIGLNTGEIPINRGYTPSVFTMLPELLERAGKNKKGSITAVYTVLVEGDDDNEIISDTIRGILDGHIVLSRKLANKNHYPAIDTAKSISRLMDDIVDIEHKKAATNIKNILSYYYEKEDYLNIAYQQGDNEKIDTLIQLYHKIEKFLVQNREQYSFDDIKNILLKDFLNIEINF